MRVNVEIVISALLATSVAGCSASLSGSTSGANSNPPSNPPSNPQASVSIASDGSAYLTAVNGTVYFNAGANRTLHTYAQGQIMDLGGTSGGTDQARPWLYWNGLVYFSSNNAQGNQKLFVWNRIQHLQASDTNPGGSDAISSVALWNNAVYFSAVNSAGLTKLYRHTGTGIASSPVAEIRAGQDDGIQKLEAALNALYMEAKDSNGYRKLFKYDGAFTRVSNSNGNADDQVSAVFQITSTDVGYRTLLNVFGTSYGSSLYSHDGVGISLRSSCYSGGAAGHVTEAVQWNASWSFGYNVIYAATDCGNGAKGLWRHDGTAVFALAPAIDPSQLTAVDANAICFRGKAPSGYYKMLCYDGSSVGQVADVSPGHDESFSDITVIGSTMYFAVTDDQNTRFGYYRYSPGAFGSGHGAAQAYLPGGGLDIHQLRPSGNHLFLIATPLGGSTSLYVD